MKKIFWIIIILIVIFLVLGFLYSQGIINVKWQPLAMILAAFAAPFTFLTNFLSGKSVRTNKILEDQKKSMDKLKNRREKYEVFLEEKNQRIEELKAEVVKLKDDIDKQELEMKEKENQINNMSDIEELQDAFMEGYIDES